MKYCVMKDTTKVIDGSENSVKIMLQNTVNAGISEAEVEILTEEEYLERKRLTTDIETEVGRLKQALFETDYVVLKIAEGTATAEEYTEIISQRQAWRAEINSLITQC